MTSSDRLNSLSARDCAALLHPMTDLVRHREEGPLTIVRGDGVRVQDEEGKNYIEAVSGLWSISLGFGQKRLADAAYKQMIELPSYHLFRHMSHPRAIELAERLLLLAPAPMSKVFFANSGSEANDTAVKLAWYYNNALSRPKKKKIIARTGGYHGVTVASASMTGLSRNHTDFDLPLPGFLHTDCPCYWKYGHPGESEADFTNRLVRSLEEVIQREGAETVAAFIAEPVMGVGGVIFPPQGYFERISEILRQHDILFIADEVITGFGRLGKMFGSEVYRLKPDILTCAKGLSSGYLPISAVMISEPIWEACYKQSGKIGAFGHGFTYSGHPVSAAVALETLRLYEELDILSHVRQNAPVLQDGLRQLSNHPLVGNTRGMGYIGAIELVADKESKVHFPSSVNVGLFAERSCLAHGIIVRLLGDTIAIAPPLSAGSADLEAILSALALALDDTLDYARHRGLI
jgi:4-aminobutyrate---pyruvate transaminase